MRVIVVGGGEVGFALSQSLASRHDVVVIDHTPVVADRFEQLDVQFLVGVGTSAETLGKAGIGQADVLVACTGLDEVNIVVCALGKQQSSARTFCFVSREDFIHGAYDPKGLSALGIDRLVWPEAQLAADIEQTVRTPGALHAEVFAGGAIHLEEYRVEDSSTLIDQTLATLGLPAGALMVGVRRDDAFFISRGDSRLEAGDRTVLMGTPEALHDVQERLAPLANRNRPRVAIIGGGRRGIRACTSPGQDSVCRCRRH